MFIAALSQQESSFSFCAYKASAYILLSCQEQRKSHDQVLWTLTFIFQARVWLWRKREQGSLCRLCIIRCRILISASHVLTPLLHQYLQESSPAFRKKKKKKPESDLWLSSCDWAPSASKPERCCAGCAWSCCSLAPGSFPRTLWDTSRLLGQKRGQEPF